MGRNERVDGNLGQRIADLVKDLFSFHYLLDEILLENSSK